MIVNLKKALKNSFIYGLGNIATKIVGFVLLPLYMDKFSISEYGALGLLEATSQVIIVFFGYNISSGFTRWYFEPKILQNKKSFFSTIFYFLFFSILCFSTIILFLTEDLSELIFDSTQFTYILKIMVIVSMAEILSVLILTVLKLEERSIYYTVLNLVKVTLILSLTIYFIVYHNQGLEGIYHAQVYGHIIFFLLSFPIIRKNLIFSFNFGILKDVFSYSLPLMFSSISLLVLTQFDRYMLGSMKALESVGEYTLGFKFANSLKVFLVFSVQTALTPIIYKIINQPGSKRFYSKIMTYFTFGLIPFSLIISIYSGKIITFLSDKTEYLGAEKIIPIISLAVIFGMLKDTSVIGLNISKKTKIIGIITVFISILNVILNYYLIPIYDTIGAALATLISQFVYFVLIYRQAQTHYRIPYELKKIILMLSVAISLYFVTQKINDQFMQYSIYINMLFILSFPIWLYLLKFYDKIELETVNKILKKYLGKLWN